MRQLEEVIKSSFPQENVTSIYSVKLMKETERVFNIPMSYYKDPGIGLYKDLKIAETNNYWFIDSRYNVQIKNRLLALATLFIFLILFGKQFLSTDFWFVGIFIIVFIVYFLINLFFSYQGLLINVYKKDWTELKRENNKLNFEITLPKYSKDALWKLKYGNKLLDFLGLTISSAQLKINYSFEINKNNA